MVFTQAGSLSPVGSPRDQCSICILIWMMMLKAPSPSSEVDMSEGKTSLERHLGSLEEWSSKNCMKFNKDKCTVWGDITEEPSTGLRLCGWAAALPAWGPGGQQAECQSAEHRCSNKGKLGPGLHVQGCYWQRWQRNHPTWCWSGHAWSAVSSSCSHK